MSILHDPSEYQRTFETLRHVVVDDIPNVGLIDTLALSDSLGKKESTNHAKRYGCDYAFHKPLLPQLEYLRASLVGHVRMKGHRVDSPGT